MGFCFCFSLSLLSVTSSAHFLPWIKLGLSGHLKREICKWHFKQAIDSFIFIMHMASKCVCDEGTPHPGRRFVYGVINTFLHSNLSFPVCA